MILPAIGAGFILTFTKGLGEFATQAFLGLPIQFYTFSTRIYSSFNNQLYGEGYVLALILITITSAIVILNQILIGTRKQYVTISGKGSPKKEINLRSGKHNHSRSICICFYILIWSINFTYYKFMKDEGVNHFGISTTLLDWSINPDNAMGQPAYTEFK
jgi:iron(III) transport system permease protein